MPGRRSQTRVRSLCRPKRSNAFEGNTASSRDNNTTISQLSDLLDDDIANLSSIGPPRYCDRENDIKLMIEYFKKSKIKEEEPKKEGRR